MELIDPVHPLLRPGCKRLPISQVRLYILHSILAEITVTEAGRQQQLDTIDWFVNHKFEPYQRKSAVEYGLPDYQAWNCVTCKDEGVVKENEDDKTGKDCTDCDLCAWQQWNEMYND